VQPAGKITTLMAWILKSPVSKIHPMTKSVVRHAPQVTITSTAQSGNVATVILVIVAARSMARAGVERQLEMVIKCAIAVAPRLLGLLRGNRRIGVQGTYNRICGCN